MYLVEAAKRGVLQFVCSAAARKLKLDMKPGGEISLKDISEEFIMVVSIAFSRTFLTEHFKILSGNLEIKNMGLNFHNIFSRTFLPDRLKYKGSQEQDAVKTHVLVCTT